MSQAKTKSTMQTSTAIIIAGLAFLAGLLIGSLIAASINPAPAARSGVSQNATDQQMQATQERNAALAQIEADIEREPNNALHWIHLGNLYYDSHMHPEAIAAYEKALQLNPDEPDVLTDLGTSYRANGEPQKAIQVFDQVIQQYPDHQYARFNKGVTQMFDLEQPAAAYQTWKDLLAAIPDVTLADGSRMADVFDELLTSIGLDFADMSKPDLALQVFDLALAENPANQPALLYKAQLLRNMGRNDEALPLWRTAYQADPQAVAPDGTPVSALANPNN